MSEYNRILLVDDQGDDLEGYRLALEGADDTEIRSASDGPQALVVAAKFNPDVLVVDLHMPGMSGAMLVQEIDEQTEIPPAVIIVTGREDILDDHPWLRDRAERVFTKSKFEPAELQNAVDKLDGYLGLLGLKRENRQLKRKLEKLNPQRKQEPARGEDILMELDGLRQENAILEKTLARQTIRLIGRGSLFCAIFFVFSYWISYLTKGTMYIIHPDWNLLGLLTSLLLALMGFREMSLLRTKSSKEKKKEGRS